ncbi:hypothetical protein [Pedobacter rhodius]|uniref:Uncharacterized protein n=1 Tax=Pedobacter rhodius TaxID=3004098 RepID=A0ABT4KU99_9SPHI|nr:hypothetical protein [Pedobacter sp. SJ11]MCZ4222516.1 hypothetical protein [Pedobacter sp. SJ11]
MMRNLITLFFILFGLSAVAQVTVVHADSVRLGTVSGVGGVALYGKTYLKNLTEGTFIDSVLVVNGSGKIRFIKRSEFAAGGGGNYILVNPSSPQEASIDISGMITVKGTAQFEGQTNSKNRRVLYGTNPYSQRDTQQGYIEETTLENYLTGGLNQFHVLGFFFSEAYFSNSFEMFFTSYDGAINRKYVVIEGYGGGGDGGLGEENSTGWFKIIPSEDGGTRDGMIDLEAKYIYPYGWWIRIRRTVSEQDNYDRSFSLYTKTYQGTFIPYDSAYNGVIGSQTGVDSVACTSSYGGRRYAQRMEVYGAPVKPTDVVRLQDLGGTLPASGNAFIQANPIEPQLANVDLNGSIALRGDNGITANNASLDNLNVGIANIRRAIFNSNSSSSGNYVEFASALGIANWQFKTDDTEDGFDMFRMGLGGTDVLHLRGDGHLTLPTIPSVANADYSLLVRDNNSGEIKQVEVNANRAASAAEIKQFSAKGSGNGSSTTISIPHGLPSINTSASVVVTANNAAAAGISYATIDAEYVNVFYTIAPVTGTNNLSYSISIK